MASEGYCGRSIQVIDFDDATVGEHVIEFVDPAISESDAVVVVYSRGSTWDDARVTISPRVVEVSAAFMSWALGIARSKIEPTVV